MTPTIGFARPLPRGSFPRMSSILALATALAACGGAPTGPGADQAVEPAGIRIGAPPGVEILPGQSVQAAVDTHPTGTTFVIRAGVHRRQRIRPKDGMTFIGDPGAILDGELAVDFAFLGSARDVTIRGLVIQRYAPGAQMGAVKAGGHASGEGTHGWRVEACEIRHNDGAGIRLGHGMVVRGNTIHHNRQIGIVGIGDDVLVEDNEISYNNHERDHSYLWEAGGAKFVKTRRLVVRGNHVHHNWGPGLWTDIDNIDALIEENRVEDNADTGIFHEIGYRAVVRNNTVRRNGHDRADEDWAYGAGILIAHSSDVDVYGNVVEDNQNGILAIQQRRGRGAYGPHDLDRLRVHDNTIVQRTGRWAAGVAQDVRDREVFSRDLRFERNRYTLGSPEARAFAWLDSRHGKEAWQAFGQDPGATFAW